MLKAADYTRWKRKSTWRLDEAVALMLGIEPNQEIQEDDQVYDDYLDMLDTARRSEGKDLQTTSRTHGARRYMIYASVYTTVFLKWAKGKEYDIPKELADLLDSPEMQPESVEESEPLEKDAISLKKIEQRLLVIEGVILGIGYDPLAIPGGGKQHVKTACLKDAGLFTDSTFKKAWQEAVRREVVRMALHKKYTHT